MGSQPQLTLYFNIGDLRQPVMIGEAIRVNPCFFSSGFGVRICLYQTSLRV